MPHSEGDKERSDKWEGSDMSFTLGGTQKGGERTLLASPQAISSFSDDTDRYSNQVAWLIVTMFEQRAGKEPASKQPSLPDQIRLCHYSTQNWKLEGGGLVGLMPAQMPTGGTLEGRDKSKKARDRMTYLSCTSHHHWRMI